MINSIIAKRHVLTAALLGSLALTACQTAPKPLYQWEGYQVQVYQYFKGQSKQEQIISLEGGLEKIKTKGNVPPPGFHAQLGLLYSDEGRFDAAAQQFQSEKDLFPESSGYMDFLLGQMKKK